MTVHPTTYVTRHDPRRRGILARTVYPPALPSVINYSLIIHVRHIGAVCKLEESTRAHQESLDGQRDRGTTVHHP